MSTQGAVLLPSDVADTEQRDQSPCGICRRQFSKYKCPTCNVGYCSLQCFRSQPHAQCSETFCRKEVESDIKTAPSSSTQERLKMMELLKRFEEETEADFEDTSDDTAGNQNALAQRFAGVDLDSTDAEDVWELLTPDERKKFLKAVENPSSELSQRLLASEELEKDRREPWWEDPRLDNDSSTSAHVNRYGDKPEMMTVPPSLVQPSTPGGHLVYNLCAILIAYAYTTRKWSVSPLSSLAPGDPDHEEACCQISRLVPFLAGRKATTVHQSLTSVVTDFWSRFDTMNADLFSLLLTDAARIIRPLSVVVVPSPTLGSSKPFSGPHAHDTTILALSDLVKLFEGYHTTETTTKSPARQHITQKLVFYAAHVLSTRTVLLAAVAQELTQKSSSIQTVIIPTDKPRSPHVVIFRSEISPSTAPP